MLKFDSECKLNLPYWDGEQINLSSPGVNLDRALDEIKQIALDGNFPSVIAIKITSAQWKGEESFHIDFSTLSDQIEKIVDQANDLLAAWDEAPH